MCVRGRSRHHGLVWESSSLQVVQQLLGKRSSSPKIAREGYAYPEQDPGNIKFFSTRPARWG